MKADDERATIAAEAALIEKNANYASEAQLEASNVWRTVQLWVMIPVWGPQKSVHITWTGYRGPLKVDRTPTGESV